MGSLTAEDFEFGLRGDSAGDGGWPQTRTQALVFAEPHLKIGHDALKTNLCRHKTRGTSPAVSQASPGVAARCRATLGGSCSIASMRSPHISPGFTSSSLYHRWVGGLEPTYGQRWRRRQAST